MKNYQANTIYLSWFLSTYDKISTIYTSFDQWNLSFEIGLLSCAQTYLQLPLRQCGAGNVYLLVLSGWKVNIAENPIAVMGL